MLLLIVDLLHSLGQMRLQLVVRVHGLGDPLLKGRVRVGPVTPHVVRALCHQVIHIRAKTLGIGAGAYVGKEMRWDVYCYFS